jgi:signal peptide peptidase SppA
MSNTPPNGADHSHSASLESLFPGGIAALSGDTALAVLGDYAHHRTQLTGNPAEQARLNGLQAPGGMARRAPYEVRPGGVALMEVNGLLLQRPGILARVYLGAQCLAELASAVKEAAADASVRSVLMVINSPGGGVHGTAELAAAVGEAATKKPVVAVTESMATSAAYWVASACSAVYASGPTVMAGSIGVVSMHVYAPRADGMVVTEVKSGKFKTVGSSTKPLTQDDRAHLQERIDYIATQFIGGVAANRGLPPRAVADQEARVYIGQQAIDAGLVDGFLTAAQLEQQLAADPAPFMRRKKTGSAAAHASAQPPTANGTSEQDLKAEAAERYRQHRLAGGGQPRVMAWDAWVSAGLVRGARDSVHVVEGMRREGYLHPYLSESKTVPRGTPGAPSKLKLSGTEQTERAKAWAQFKGTSFIDAVKDLGFAA